MYQNKGKKYFNTPRLEIIELIPKNKNNRILEIGSGSGETLIEIKKLKLAKEVVGVDLMKLTDSQQQNPEIDKIIIGDIENIELDFPNDYFDVIIYADVLEHLIDPWNTLKKLHKYLTKDGHIIVSIPNIREIQTLYKIVIKADFKYENKGILDRTHLRFFCKKNIISLLTSTKYTPISIHSGFKLVKSPNKIKLIDKLTLGLFRDFLTGQYIVVARKNEPF